MRNSALKAFMGISGSEHRIQSIGLLSNRDTRAGNGRGENEIKPNMRSNQYSVHLEKRNMTDGNVLKCEGKGELI